MKRIALLSFLVGSVVYGQTPSPCKTDSAYRQFDFWIGEWDVENPNGQVVGRSSIQLIEGDCVLLENYASMRNLSYTGKSFNVYNAAIGRWQQFWVDSQGGVLEFKGEYKDRELRYTAESIGPQNQRTLHRLTFFDRENGTVRQLWEQSTDEGSTWTVAFDGLYRKRK
jgi:hypothetical protein